MVRLPRVMVEVVVRMRDWRGAVTACGAVAAVLAVTGFGQGRAFGLEASAVRISVTPANGSGAVKPNSPITIHANRGRLENVTVTQGGDTVDGTISVDGASWKSRWALHPGTTYHVLTTGLGTDGRTGTSNASFTVAKVNAAAPAVKVVAPNQGETVGVGMPIIMRFNSAVTNRAAVEGAMEVRSSKPIRGAWHWLDSKNLVFRTQKYWPADVKVKLTAHLAGVQESNDTYGTQDIERDFRIGDSHITVGSAKTHHEIVRRNGKVVRNIPVSMGRGGSQEFTTTDGIHLTMDKSYLTVMTSPGLSPGSPGYYSEDVYWTVRISDTGEYEHAAPWSVGDQGYSNVSHGCVNMSTANAMWFYHFSHRGDIVKITGTDRPLDPTNGWGYWQESWPKWLKYSALHQEVATEAMDGSAQSDVPVQSAVQQQAAPAAPAATPTATAHAPGHA